MIMRFYSIEFSLLPASKFVIAGHVIKVQLRSEPLQDPSFLHLFFNFPEFLYPDKHFPLILVPLGYRSVLALRSLV